jgi:hypothetical protein
VSLLLETAATIVAASVPLGVGLHHLRTISGLTAAVAPAPVAPAPAPAPPVAPASEPLRRVTTATHCLGPRHHGQRMVTDGTYLHVTEAGTTKSYPLAGFYYLEFADD